ncbi:MAG: hypothetical protein KDC87_02850 [Planctomycetes bacterium]|nr:hypothetical protein [Planctomycetota bacterium]MCB9872286.1 hypothetical protein [Planctomycetota bacterium]
MADLRGDRAAIDRHVHALRQRLADESRRHADLARTTTVPLEALDIGDPILEAALTDSAMQIFLRHMISLVDGPRDTPEAVDQPRQDAIPRERVLEVRDRLAAMEPCSAPDLALGFEDERLWILIDLLHSGDMLSQHRATVELRSYMNRIRAREVEVGCLPQVVEALRGMDKRPLVLDLLLECARQCSEAHSDA